MAASTENASSDKVRSLLASLACGDNSAADELFPLLYDELHRLAARYMSHERSDHTLQATALIHEAWLRLVPQQDEGAAHFENRGHFLSAAALAMRRILVNHARQRNSEKRRGTPANVSIDSIAEEFQNSAIDLLALDDALEKLKQLNETQYRIVELRFFGGMTFGECAEWLGLSERTVYYEWAHARAWLRSQVEPGS